VAELPVSVRLGNILQTCGCRILGDLDRRDEGELLALKNCGRTTIRELRELLRRAAAGEFSPESGTDRRAAWAELRAQSIRACGRF
jgi:DNA-directed RNA polymerase alpha subunit